MDGFGETKLTQAASCYKSFPKAKRPPLGSLYTKDAEFCLEASGRASKPVHRLFKAPGDDSFGVVAVAENVIAGREAVFAALYLHFVELVAVELVIADGAPVDGR